MSLLFFTTISKFRLQIMSFLAINGSSLLYETTCSLPHFKNDSQLPSWKKKRSSLVRRRKKCLFMRTKAKIYNNWLTAIHFRDVVSFKNVNHINTTSLVQYSYVFEACKLKRNITLPLTFLVILRLPTSQMQSYNNSSNDV